MKEFSSSPLYTGNEVKFTGAVEDRVNLWPLAYWREPVGSVAWPLVSWGDDHFALRPVYSRYGREHNFLWPIGQYDSATGDGRAFPVFWGKDRFNVFPLVWNNNKFHSLFPLFFWEELNGDVSLDVFPGFTYDSKKNGHTKTSFLWRFFRYERDSGKIPR